MFTQPTVFVLGAGASRPYDYPTGQELVDSIIAGAEKDIFRRTRREEGFDDEQMAAFTRALARGKPASIDAFLEANPRFLEVGRLCIAQRLIVREDDEALFRKSNAEHWYAAFFRHLAPTKRAAFDNQVTIVTFNYDRSLEHFLYEAFMGAFGATSEEAKEFVSRLHIIHVHGKLGDLPWQSETGMPYGVDVNRDSLRIAVRGIKIIHEAGNEPGFEDAKRSLMEARYIFFLGFGFHRLNLKRLALPFDRKPRYDGDLSLFAGTCHGSSEAHREILTEQLGRQVIFPATGYRIHDFMREYLPFLHAAEGRLPPN